MIGTFLRALAITGILGIVIPAANAQERTLTVFAAASLKDALDSLALRFESERDVRVSVSYAGTPALARQIEQGAPADVFISADPGWMDYLQERALIVTDTRFDLVGNSLVLVAPADAAGDVALSGSALATRLDRDGRLALALVDSVPAGRYAKAGLENLGLWSEVEGRLAQAENVRAALAFVARGEAPLGIVYSSDAAAEPRVAVAAQFPDGSHPPIIYPAAVTAEGREPAMAHAFLEVLRSPAASAIFRAHGFEPLAEKATQ